MSTHMKKLFLLYSGIVLLSIWGGIGTAVAAGMIEAVFNPANFSNPLDINNPYWFLVPGTTFTYRSVGVGQCEVNDVEVTDVTVLVAGVNTRQVHDQVWEDDNCNGGRDFLSEDTLDWYAQDNDGNVWYLGEATAEYCDRDQPQIACSTEGSWMAGVDGATPGFAMLANPTPGTFYRQEFLAGEAEDMAKVLRTNATVVLIFDNAIDLDHYTGCLKTKEWSALERGAVENKYYCPGVGLVLINGLKSQTVRTELVEISGP